MKRFIEGDNRGQSTLFPEGLEDLVDGNNPVRVMPTLSLQTFGHLPQPAQPFIASLFSPKTAPAPSCQAVAGGDTVKKSVSPNKRRNSDNGNSAAAQIFFYRNLSTTIEYPIQFSARRSARQPSYCAALKNPFSRARRTNEWRDRHSLVEVVIVLLKPDFGEGRILTIRR